MFNIRIQAKKKIKTKAFFVMIVKLDRPLSLPSVPFGEDFTLLL